LPPGRLPVDPERLGATLLQAAPGRPVAAAAEVMHRELAVE